MVTNCPPKKSMTENDKDFFKKLYFCLQYRQDREVSSGISAHIVLEAKLMENLLCAYQYHEMLQLKVAFIFLLTKH